MVAGLVVLGCAYLAFMGYMLYRWAMSHAEYRYACGKLDEFNELKDKGWIRIPYADLS
jgi:hypothetical protein